MYLTGHNVVCLQEGKRWKKALSHGMVLTLSKKYLDIRTKRQSLKDSHLIKLNVSELDQGVQDEISCSGSTDMDSGASAMMEW